KQLKNSQHTRIPVFRSELDNVVGILHHRKLLQNWSQTDISHEVIESLVEEAYYVPETTPLNRQLLSFQRQKRRMGLVVDEYGDIQGLVTLDDILEEIVGEFTTDPSDSHPDVLPQADGSVWIKARVHVRDLNRILEWDLPTDGPKTLNGLIVENLETIPEPGTELNVSGQGLKIIKVSDNAVKTVQTLN
ncbi:MAG: transporter associated domain-containing protein, partial [Pseudomonadota bacterium]